jgi:hypothetical protein
MPYTLEEKYALIRASLLKATSKDPITIAKSIMKKDFIDPNGPEHHLLDGGSFLAAYHNAGGKIDLPKALDALASRSVKMPGAMCGYWGVCGSVTSVGSALSVIHGTGPLSSDDYYKDQMEFTSSVIEKMSRIGGPRCCKRNAFLSLSTAVEFVKRKYGVEMSLPKKIVCEFSAKNPQCLKERCPFNPSHR